MLLTGIVVTARDAGHKLMVEERPQFLDDLLREGVIYHCGPVVKKEGERWSFVAAGPTTSAREEPYQAKVIESYTVRGVIGKGGMGAATLRGLPQVRRGLLPRGRRLRHLDRPVGQGGRRGPQARGVRHARGLLGHRGSRTSR